MNVEARPVTAAVFTRKCIIAKLKELTIDKYKEMVQQSAGGLLILLPTQIDDLNKEEQEVGELRLKRLIKHFSNYRSDIRY